MMRNSSCNRLARDLKGWVDYKGGRSSFEITKNFQHSKRKQCIDCTKGEVVTSRENKVQIELT